MNTPEMISSDELLDALLEEQAELYSLGFSPEDDPQFYLQQDPGLEDVEDYESMKIKQMGYDES